MITYSVLVKGIADAIKAAVPGAKVYSEKIPQGGNVGSFFHVSFDAMTGEASGVFQEKRGITATIRFFPAHSVQAVDVSSLAWAAFHTLNKKVFGSNIEFRAAAADPFPVVADNVSGTFTRANHGIPSGRIGQFTATALPTGILAATDYYLVSPTDDTFKVSLEKGGTAVSFTDDGEGIVFSIEKVRSLSLFRRRGEVVDDVLVFRFDLDFEEILDTAEMAETFDLMAWFKMVGEDANAGEFIGESGEEPIEGD